MSRLRILGLHGYHGSADILRSQARGLTEAIEPLAELVYVDAPSLAAGDFGWWHAEPDRDAGHTGGVRRYRGWSKTRDWLLAMCDKRGPFDGVFGFSQGAALAALLAAMCALDPAGRPGFRFAIMVGGFVSNDVRHAPLLFPAAGIPLPSLHIIGRSDLIVASQASHALAQRFVRPTIVEHEGGHAIASTPEVRSAARTFLSAMADHKATSSGAVAPAGVASATMSTATSGLPAELPLWPNKKFPAMRVFAPRAPNGAPARPRPVLIVLRGGGYSICNGSGAGTAVWAARNGMVGIEVDYSTRAVGASYPAPYADAARAVRLVRHHAREWGIDPARIALLGYSAGGHLASLVSTQPALPSPDDDLAATVSARPDLLVLGYPVISFSEGYRPGQRGAMAGSAENFFGRMDVSEELRKQFSNELHVEPGHPPVFVWTTADDALVPAWHSQRFAEAARRAGVPVELIVYPHGPHGMGLALDQSSEVSGWTVRLADWLTQQWGPLK